MIIKKFQAETETEAILLAKEELGKDAIVMNIKVIKPRGLYKFFKKPVVEVTAAMDDDIEYVNGEKMLSDLQKIKKEQTIIEQGLTGQSVVQQVSTVQPAPAIQLTPNVQQPSKPQNLPPLRSTPNIFNNPNIIIEEEEKEDKSGSFAETAIEQRLNELQSLLEKRIQVKPEKQEENEEEKQESKISVYIRLIKEQMLNNEVDEKYIDQIIDEIKSSLNEESTVDNALATVYQKIILKIGQIKTIEFGEGHPKYIFFIGPTGVGKTTTIAKIASDLKLKRKANIALVTSDTYRIAAVEQLRTYANILSIPLKVVYTSEEMEEIKTEFADYDIVLIDTAGRSHQSKEQREDVIKLLSIIPEEEREAYLVLSATTKYRDLIKISEVYSEIVNYNLIFTKLDETECVGNILNIHMLTDAPLSYVTCGQNVPDDIGKIDVQSIAKKLLGGNK